MTDTQTNANLEKELRNLNALTTTLLRAERLKLLGPDRVKSVWYDNYECKFFLPDALEDRIQTLILETGRFFEMGNLRYIEDIIKPGSVVVDIGANMGNHSMFFALVCGAKQVHSFEPQAQMVQLIERNKELNGFDDTRVVVKNHGLGAITGRLKIIHQNLANLGATRFEYATTGGFEVKRLDDCGVDTVDFIKIDAEGMGPEVLKGAEGLITKCKPDIWIELYDKEIEPAHALLEEHGYTLYKQMTPHDYLFRLAGKS